MNAQRSIRLGISSLLTLALVAASTATQAQATKAPAAAKVQEKAKNAKAGDPIDVNSATHEELMVLPGVGEAISKKIIDGRPYKTVDDLTTAGVPAATVAKIKPLATAKPLPVAVDVNTATVGQLETLPGVGPAMAKAIMEGRPYSKFDDLGRVKGLGEAKLAALRGRVSFAKAPTMTEKAKAKAEAAGSAVKSKAETAVEKTKAAAETATEKTKAAAAVAAEKTKSATATVKAKAATAKEEMKGKAEYTKPKLPAGKIINLNSATKDELEMLPGVGPVHAQAIIDARPFAKIEDVMKVKGIKEVEFGKIKDSISVK
jgi:competence protein ComEA